MGLSPLPLPSWGLAQGPARLLPALPAPHVPMPRQTLPKS